MGPGATETHMSNKAAAVRSIVTKYREIEGLSFRGIVPADWAARELARLAFDVADAYGVRAEVRRRLMATDREARRARLA